MYQSPFEAHVLFDEGYESSDDDDNNNHSIVPTNMPPGVNLKNVLSGFVVILTEKIGFHWLPQIRKYLVQMYNFLALGRIEIAYLTLLYTSSVPPHFEPSGADYSSYKEVFEAEPLEWIPDSSDIVAKHDVMDRPCARRLINLLIELSMEHEIYKACNTLTN
ncbi:unnamed protein product [Lupinus luteus]|uniref:Uncharacterized protein n=1 Tax=Lupinus luteus TaxID=3873 RepID=A0AAV1WDF5_LUPLU